MNKTTLESLSNELLLDLFELFDVVNLLRAFSGLNTRFNSLLYTDVRSYRVDLRSISKEDFNILYPAYLPLISNRIIYLRLSDDEDTPCHIEQRQFRFEPQSIYFSDLHELHNLTNLKFVHCRLYHLHVEDFRDVIDQIWKLPKLSHLYWDFTFKYERHFSMPTYLSTSLQYLTIRNYNCCSYDFSRLFEKTPRLRKFFISSNSDEDDDLPFSHEFLPAPQSLSVTRLILLSIRSLPLMTSLFKLLPSITRLKVEIYSITLDGHQWKEMIVNYLPQLKDFQFKIDLGVGYEPWMFHDEALSHIQLTNIEKLSLQLPIDQQFFSIIPKLENLLSLTVAIPTENHRLQLQALLDRAPRLFALAFKFCVTSAMPPYRYTSSSICRLDLQGYDPSRRRHRYDIRQCMELSRSSIGIQCRILAIEVEKPKCILQLIYSMLNLRTLHVSYENDKRSNQYDLVEVLQHYLPSTWSITRFCYGHIIIQS
ncbi:unnamed protein product [Rotaria magnacalcarata]|uniref:F-box domain-containing protein n=1 Tax=Rotaria magnacalcarata TaxID=392030 RepID=A0A815B0L8_9BILA|nr:unnamed protein product [Rotaria magnacalcarata]CAF4602569.1 unnamed protein product [Rotaria magnacalcarata]